MADRNWIAQSLREMINPIENKVCKEWGLNFLEIQFEGLEPKFDREVIKRIKEHPEAYSRFKKFMECVREGYGNIFEEFSQEQKEIITLKESKLSL